MRSKRVPAGAIPRSTEPLGMGGLLSGKTTEALARQSPDIRDAWTDPWSGRAHGNPAESPDGWIAAVPADCAAAAMPSTIAKPNGRPNLFICAMFLFCTPSPAALAAFTKRWEGVTLSSAIGQSFSLTRLG